MAEEVKRTINVSRTSLETLDVKGENTKMLSLMNVVIKQRDAKQEIKRRDMKHKNKQEVKNEKQEHQQQQPQTQSLVDSVFRPRPEAFKGETPIVAVDCEMVEVDRCSDALARVSIVNYNGQVLYDHYVRPESRITNFRTWVSGVHPHHMKDAKPFKQAKQECHKLLKGKIIVGHALTGDFRVLELDEAFVAKEKVRDTSRYRKYQNDHGQAQSLKVLTEKFLLRKIQSGSHCSVTDARAALALYRISEQEWENQVKQKSYTNVKRIVHQDIGKMAAFFGQKVTKM
ncbi:hypothetical protein FGO68_gene11969 [Halteria grandinella]|uniref:RNA exonuclease 4 n=1 Tax=Halteria grandinella TaxID=5974 RepID=A0A8J8P098_HALGN|nr:hypothetical protein FGO68_gene11969 [Halteria grandinella]